MKKAERGENALMREIPRQSHLFVDECKAKDYYLAAVFAASSNLGFVRNELRTGRHKGTDFVHFVRERDVVRDRFINIMRGCGITAAIYVSDATKHAVAREACIHAMLNDVMEHGIRELTIESDASVDAADRRIIANHLKEFGYADLRYRHRGKKEEPLLWASDAIAWCYNRGGRWRQKIEALIISVRPC